MRKIFIIAVDADALATERDAFTKWLRSAMPHVGFWHHMSHTWIIIDPRGGFTCATLRDQISEFIPSASRLVFEVTSSNWAAFAPTASHKWLHAYLGPHK